MFKLREIFPETDLSLKKAMVVLLTLVAFFLPFKFLVNVFIVLSLVAWLLSNPFKKLFTKNRYTKVLIAILLFYLLHSFALLYTNNMQEGLFSLEIKISMFIFPLLFYTEEFSQKQSHFFLKSFIAGTLLCCLACLIRAVFMYLRTNESHFYYEGFSWFQHPSYLSMYVTFCSVALLKIPLFNKLQTFLLVALFTLFILFLASKTGLLIHFLLLILCVSSLFFKVRNYFKITGILLAGLFIFGTCLFFIPTVKQRFSGALISLQTGNRDKTSTESTAVRKLIWNEAIQILKQHPILGVSPGDANDTLYERYRQNGLTGAYEKKLNAHSQYFQTTVGLGLIGLASLLALFVIPAFINRKGILVFFLLITALNFLTESMLQTMAGCIFFGYFYAMLSFNKAEEKKT
jgi:O-antigen ligase